MRQHTWQPPPVHCSPASTFALVQWQAAPRLTVAHPRAAAKALEDPRKMLDQAVVEMQVKPCMCRRRFTSLHVHTALSQGLRVQSALLMFCMCTQHINQSAYA